mgnify:CR=1 FL=1|jgi:dolichol-phosphate mannosyltransferase
MQPVQLSVIIPAKNEAENLPDLLDEIAISLHGITHEIVVVDDGSSDNTWSLLCRRTVGDSRLRPLRHAHSAGQSTSLWQAARHAQGDWLATLDGDGQNDPADIPRLLEAARDSDLALIAGHRVARQDSWLKRVSSRTANRVRAALLKDATPDTGCGLKLIRREAFLTLPYFDHMHRFLPALVQAQGGRCLSLAVNHRPRRAGQSKYGLHDRLWVGLVDIAGVLWLQRRCRLPAALEIAPGTGDTARDQRSSTEQEMS